MTSKKISFKNKAPPQFVEVAVISVAPTHSNQPSLSAPPAQTVQEPQPSPPEPFPVKTEATKPKRPQVQRKTRKPKTNTSSPRLPPAPGNANPPHTAQDEAAIAISGRPGGVSASPPVKVTAADFRLPMLNNPPTEYPPLALRNGYEGTVKLRVLVLASGLPGEIQIQRSSGHSVLDESAAKQLKRWRFVPARRGETAIDSWIIVPITFQLNQ